MVAYSAQYTQSTAASTPHNSSVTFGTDIAQSHVYLSVEIIPSHSFARLMLALGRVVRMQDTGIQRDHSAYQEWVQGQYLKELSSQVAADLAQLPDLLAEANRLEALVAPLQSKIVAYNNTYLYRKEQRAYWKWLDKHNRELWYILDPIVSVQPDATFFEAFSLDESTYARVVLPHSATRCDNKPVYGTTNIDFSVGLEREFARTRSYRPLHLTVGADSVTIDTGLSSTKEKKIDLPDSWVRGLVEVQAALSLAPIELKISSSAFADVLARLDAEREKHGPRALVFELVPGEVPRIIVEPWGDVFQVSDNTYLGSENRMIKVWGRRRLRVLKDLLPLVPELTVRLVDSGMPSFWSIEIEGVCLTIGLSGWSSQDWAGRARFSAMIPSSDASTETVEEAANLLKTNQLLSVDELATALNSSPVDTRRILQRLCLAGLAMYDPDSARYRWRALFPTINLESDSGSGREERKGIELFQGKTVEFLSDEITSQGRVLKGSITSGDRINTTTIQRDVDGRVMHAQCDCSHFRYHKLRQGPCRHIVAMSLAGG